MPRTTNHRYIQNHHDLHRIRQHRRSVFSLLSTKEQGQLHDYFRFTEDLSREALLRHREVVSAAKPSLPQQTGKAYRKLQLHLYGTRDRRLVAARSSRTKARRSKVRPEDIHVRGLVHPHPDASSYARAVLALARQLQDQDPADRSARAIEDVL